jgi:hypothetical protein
MMAMKTQFIFRWLTVLFSGGVLLATLLLVSCGDDPEPANEEELITTLTVTLTPQGGGVTVTMTFRDLDGPGSGIPEYIYSGGGSAAVLAVGTTYDAGITLLNETETPAENVTEEIEEEADEHLFCFNTTLGGLTITYADTEADYLAGGSSKVVGLATTWTTGSTPENGTVTIILRHQPGTKTGDCPGSGETDIEVTFNVSVK